MGTSPTKAAANVYCQARLEASKYNDKLKSREGAAELLGISVATLADYELSTVKFMPVDRVVMMADLYRAPELTNYYCTSECPIGRRCQQRLELSELDRLTVKLLSAFRKGETVKDVLLDITEDGVIDSTERDKLAEIIDYLEVVSKAAGELKLWAEKNL